MKQIDLIVFLIHPLTKGYLAAFISAYFILVLQKRALLAVMLLNMHYSSSK